jgi:hypothetical protein
MRSYLMPLALIIGIMASTSNASADFLRKGYIANDEGKKCWYKQTAKNGDKYFHKSLTSNTHTLEFDDPKCMADNGLGLGINKMMINNIITRPYSHDDAAFQTRSEELFKGSLLQTKGQCIQSKTYAIIGVTVDYLIKNSSIVKVVHGASAGSCTNN